MLRSDGERPETVRLCQVCREALGVTGAGIMLVVDDVLAGSVCTTDDVSRRIEELHYTLGEGPCIDAFELAIPVLEPDLESSASNRWPAFKRPALDAGVRAVFGFPLHLGAVRLGALAFYRDTPGPLTDDQYADAVVVAEIAAQVIITMQAGQPPGVFAQALDAGSDFHIVVNQAAGMVSVQLGTSIADALVRLRAYAFAHDRHLLDLAGDVVARRFRFDGHPDQP